MEWPVDDKRTPEAVKRATTDVHGDFEWSAANVVRRWTGRRVILQDDGIRSSMPDFRVERPDGTLIGYGEVVRDIDRKSAAAYAEISTATPTRDFFPLARPPRSPGSSPPM